MGLFTLFAPYLPYLSIVLYSIAFLLGALLLFPIIIGIGVGCGIAIRNIWKAYREALRTH